MKPIFYFLQILALKFSIPIVGGFWLSNKGKSVTLCLFPFNFNYFNMSILHTFCFFKQEKTEMPVEEQPISGQTKEEKENPSRHLSAEPTSPTCIQPMEHVIPTTVEQTITPKVVEPETLSLDVEDLGYTAVALYDYQAGECNK